MTDARRYFSDLGGLPPQQQLTTDRAVFTEAFALIPKGTMRDIVTSMLPGWNKTRAWIIARPLSGFAETFSQFIVEVSPGGGSKTPEPDEGAQGVLFVVSGELTVNLEGRDHHLRPGSYVYIPAGHGWTCANTSDQSATFHWVRKRYEPADGYDAPTAFVTHDDEVPPVVMPDCEGVWATTRFVEPDDLRHDMHVNIVTFQPGGSIPFPETHIMEHGLYVLQGAAVYLLNKEWIEVEAGDFMWLRAFCPQACVAKGPEPFRYLLYKDVNRFPSLKPFGG